MPHQAWFSSVTDGNQGKADVVTTSWQASVHAFRQRNPRLLFSVSSSSQQEDTCRARQKPVGHKEKERKQKKIIVEVYGE